MARIVISGSADCVHFARADFVAEHFAINLPDFRVEKIMKHPSEWPQFLEDTCRERNWQHRGSPMIWRKLGPKDAKLIGNCEDLLIMLAKYFGEHPDLEPSVLEDIAAENLRMCNALREKEAEKRRQEEKKAAESGDEQEQ